MPTRLHKNRAAPRRALILAIALGLGLGAHHYASAQAFSASINLGNLNGSNGFRLNGEIQISYARLSVSAAGDVNGDGLDDLIVGATGPGSDGTGAGNSYVIFGRNRRFADTINIADVDGSNGFRLSGSTSGAGVLLGDYAGSSVSAAGDVNGDGLGDLIVGAPKADPNFNNEAGSTFVIFGRTTSFPANVSLSSLDGNTGFRLDGVTANEKSGHSVSALGDINGDGLDDIIVGSLYAGLLNRAPGNRYVIFGRNTGFPARTSLSSLNGNNGFRINVGGTRQSTNALVSAAGDMNGDGLNDLVVGVTEGYQNYIYSETYVLFGRNTSYPATVNIFDASNRSGFRILSGLSSFLGAIQSVRAAGDVNGDGLGDLIMGAPNSGDFFDPNVGTSYVLFGTRTGFPSSINVSDLDGNNGFRLDGGVARDLSGFSVNTVGDINGDALDDMIVGAQGFNLGDGCAYVVFGKNSKFAPIIKLASLNGNDGFRLDGAFTRELFGQAVSGTGDINSDGLADLIVAAPIARPSGGFSGASYVVFGRSAIFANGFE